VLKGLPGDLPTQCRQNNSVAQDMPVDFLPPYTEVQSRLHVRLVWAHDKRFHWWMPEQVCVCIHVCIYVYMYDVCMYDVCVCVCVCVCMCVIHTHTHTHTQGFEYDMVVRSYSRYNEDQNSNPQQPSSCSGLYPPTCASTSWCGLPIINNGVQLQRGVCKRLKLGLHAQFSPEFINDGNYPRPSQARPHESIITHWNSHATSLNGVKHGDALAVAVGETLEVMVRVFDRNGNDENVIKAREDPGLPPGHVITNLAHTSQAAAPGDVLATHSKITQESQLAFPPSYRTPQTVEGGSGACPSSPSTDTDTCVYNCGTRYRNSDSVDVSPPRYVDRLLSYSPREQHAGAMFRVCLYAETQNPPRMGLRRYDPLSRISNDLCFSIRVLQPAPEAHILKSTLSSDFIQYMLLRI